MSERAPDRIWSGIQITKVAAGTLAAVSAAVIGSFLGVAGTLAGAAIASIVGSVGTELYQRSLDRGAKKLQTIAPTFIKAPAAVGTPAVAAATEDDSPSHTVPEEAREKSPGEAREKSPGEAREKSPEEAREKSPEDAREKAPGDAHGKPATLARPLPWKRIGLAAALLFVLALGSLSVVELLAGKSVASMVGSSGGRTTVSSVVGDEGVQRTRQENPAPAPSESAPATEAPTGDPADAPTVAPTTEPAPDATTEPAVEPTTEAPATEAPETQAPQTGTDENQQQPQE